MLFLYKCEFKELHSNLNLFEIFDLCACLYCYVRSYACLITNKILVKANIAHIRHYCSMNILC